jgi:hypothetical protein
MKAYSTPHPVSRSFPVLERPCTCHLITGVRRILGKYWEVLCTVDDDPLCNKDAHNTHYGEPSCIKITKHISASDGRSDWNHKSAAIL